MPERANELRGGRLNEVLLEDVLQRQLATINRFETKGKQHEFSTDNIRRAEFLAEPSSYYHRRNPDFRHN